MEPWRQRSAEGGEKEVQLLIQRASGERCATEELGLTGMLDETAPASTVVEDPETAAAAADAAAEEAEAAMDETAEVPVLQEGRREARVEGDAISSARINEDRLLSSASQLAKGEARLTQRWWWFRWW